MLPVTRWTFAVPMLVAALLAAGCIRRPGGTFVGSPFDPERRLVEADISAALADRELRLGTKADYFIGAGDELGVTLVGRPDIFGEDETKERFVVLVTESPMITLPLIGAVKVHGKTADQVQDELRVAYRDFINEPVPIVTVEKYHYNAVAVLGAVTNPGRYPLEFGDTILDAVYKAGGLTFGGRSGNLPPARYLKIYREKVDRKERTEMTLDQLLAKILEEGKVLPRREIMVPIEEFIISGNLEHNLPLQPNDIVYIPAAGTVIVHGPVRGPGVTFLGPSLRTVSQVLTERGGLQYRASSWIELVRSEPDGGQTSWFLNGRDVLARRSPDFFVRDNDQLFVYTHPVRNVLDKVGSIFRATVSTGVSTTYNPVGAP